MTSELVPGQSVRYEVLRRLGSGGFAGVYLMHDRALALPDERDVVFAMKVMKVPTPAEFRADSEMLARYDSDYDRYRADVALAQALSELRKDKTFGSAGTGEVRLRPDAPDDRRESVLTFSPTAGLPWSTNNFDGGRSSGYGATPVRTGTAHLVATGRANGVGEHSGFHATAFAPSACDPEPVCGCQRAW